MTTALSGATDLPGTRLGNYEIGRRIGVGSMGAVYDCVRATDGRRVAIKVLSAELAGNPVARARFLNEPKVTARVRHPHVVDILDAGEERGQVYLVMEFLEGQDLAGRLKVSGSIPAAEAADLLIPICDALAAAHQLGITHRDLKPSNIFLAVKEGRSRPTLLDFGIAREDDGAGAANDVGAGQRVTFGTPAYLAPEVIADHRAAGPKSDQYALGVILYEAVTGERPFAAADLDQLYRAIAAGNPPSPRTLKPDVPAELDALVLRAMNVDPQKRFPSVADLSRALRPFAAAPGAKPAASRRRAPSSPAIEVEAAIPSPFTRTLAPELPTESGPWVEGDISGEATLPTLGPPPVPRDAGRKVSIAAQGARETLVIDRQSRQAQDDRWTGELVPQHRRRRLILAGSAVAIGVVGVVLLVSGGRSVPPPATSSASDTPPAIPKSEPPAPPPVQAPAPPPAEPVRAAPVAAAPPAPPPAPAAAPAPSPERPVAVKPAPPPEPERRPEVAAAPDVAPRPAAASPPRRPAPAARKPAAAQTAAVDDAIPAERVAAPPAPRRSRPNGEVRMHNGVPLLD